MKIERTADLDVAPDGVYDVLMDPGRIDEWVSIHAGFKEDPPKRLRKGSRLVQRLKVAGQRFTVTWRVTEADRPRRVVWDGEGPAGTRALVVYELEPNSDGTRFSYHNEYDLPGGPAGKLVGRAISAAAAREVESTLERLERLLER